MILGRGVKQLNKQSINQSNHYKSLSVEHVVRNLISLATAIYNLVAATL
jgi:hypothetical protein